MTKQSDVREYTLSPSECDKITLHTLKYYRDMVDLGSVYGNELFISLNVVLAYFGQDNDE